MFTKTLSNNTANALALLGKTDICTGAYLAGGTALALHLGHRISIDLDFFSSDEFDSQRIVEQFAKHGRFNIDGLTPKTINGVWNDVKLSYFHYPYHLIGATTKFEGISLASVEDIAAMKLVAITDRGTKKDYIDLFMLAKTYRFEEMFAFYDRKYGLLNENLLTLMKSLSYFFDADESEMPVMISPISWDDVKSFFVEEIRRLSKIYLE